MVSIMVNKTAKYCQRILLILAIGMLSACAGVTYHASPINVTLSNIQLVDSELLEQEYMLTLRIQNTNDSTLVINGLSYTLDINGAEFAHGVSNQQNYILPYAEKLIQVSLISSTFSALKQLNKLGKKGSSTFNYLLKGKVSLGARYVPTPIMPLAFEAGGSIKLGELLKRPELPTK